MRANQLAQSPLPGRRRPSRQDRDLWPAWCKSRVPARRHNSNSAGPATGFHVHKNVSEGGLEHPRSGALRTLTAIVRSHSDLRIHTTELRFPVTGNQQHSSAPVSRRVSRRCCLTPLAKRAAACAGTLRQPLVTHP